MHARNADIGDIHDSRYLTVVAVADRGAIKIRAVGELFLNAELAELTADVLGKAVRDFVIEVDYRL